MSTDPFESAPWNFPISNRRTSPFHPLRVSNTDAQIFALPTLETEAVSTGTLSGRNLHAQIKLGDMPTLNIWAFNQLINLNCRKSRELANTLILFQTCNAGSREGEEYSGSPEHKHCLGSLVIHCGCPYENQHPTGKEKGRTANPTLWGIYSSNYESIVFHISTYENFVGQFSGDSLAFFRCRRSSSTCAILTIARKSAPALAPISSILVSAVKASSRLDSNLSSPLSLSWRRAISPCMAETIKPALLSPSRLTSSIPLSTSYGMRTVVICDLAFLEPVDIVETPIFWCMSVYIKKRYEKELQCISCCINLYYTLILSGYKNGNAPEWWNTTEAFIHNVIGANTMESSHSTQTRPEKTYLWRFLALNRSNMGAKPCRISVEAPTEHDARRVLAPFFILSLSARLSAQGVCNE